MNDFDSTKLTGFEGYIAGKLEGIEREIADVKKNFSDLPCGETFKRLNKIENKVAGIEGKAALFGGALGLIAAWVKGSWK